MHLEQYSVTLTTFAVIKSPSAGGASRPVPCTYPSPEAYFSKSMPTFKLQWVFWSLIFSHLRRIDGIISCFDWLPGLGFGLVDDMLG